MHPSTHVVYAHVVCFSISSCTGKTTIFRHDRPYTGQSNDTAVFVDVCVQLCTSFTTTSTYGSEKPFAALDWRAVGLIEWLIDVFDRSIVFLRSDVEIRRVCVLSAAGVY
uniref:Uncharacterized protein n=1 Tax=Hyaloperonospora arabidopsidis (strain Emoy2) TaxID=559515 RepID=M4C5Y0_HYAAE